MSDARRMKFKWSPEREAILRQKWAAGVPVLEIMKALGASKDSVTGKVGRLKLPRRDNPFVKSDRTRKGVVDLVPMAIREDAAQLAPLPSIAGMTLAEEQPVGPPRVCCWPMWGDGRPTHKHCGGKRAGAWPYCEPHARVAYTSGGGA